MTSTFRTQLIRVNYTLLIIYGLAMAFSLLIGYRGAQAFHPMIVVYWLVTSYVDVAVPALVLAGILGAIYLLYWKIISPFYQFESFDEWVQLAYMALLGIAVFTAAVLVLIPLLCRVDAHPFLQQWLTVIQDYYTH